MKRFIGILFLFVIVSVSSAQGPTRWRGPSEDGIYPESGLLKKWPAEGPVILWSFEELGQGHSSAVVSGGYVFTSGMINETGFLFKFQLDGTLIWKIPYGPEYTESWYGTRGTPVIVGDRVYLVNGLGKLKCINEEDGTILWEKDMFQDFDGKNIRWGNK